MADRDTLQRAAPDGRDADEAPQSLNDAVEKALEEARMVLPGIQALFGFQLIAVFNQRFHDMGEADQLVHLAAIVATVVAIGLVMTPAAYHRSTQQRRVTAHFLRLTSRFIGLALLPLTIGIGLDVYVVARVVTESRAVAAAIAGGAAAFLGALWFAYPRAAGRRG